MTEPAKGPGPAKRRSRDSIEDVWGDRTSFYGEGEWPDRVDEFITDEPDQWVQSCCVSCSNGCALDIGVKDGTIVGVRGRAVDRVNQGRLGPKGLHFWKSNNSPLRLKRPLIRRDGALVQASWDEAMNLIAEKSRDLIEKYTGASIGFYTSGQLFLEEYYALGMIGKAGIGTPHQDGNTRLCTATAGVALRESFGTPGNPGSYRDFDSTDCILHFGHNIAETDTVLWMRILDRRRGPNPPKMIVVDIRRTHTAAEADLHLAPEPGTNLALMNGLLNLIIQSGATDRVFVEQHTIGFDELKKTVSSYTPERVEQICGVPAAQLREAGRILSETESLVSTVLQGVYQSMQATAAACQLNNLHLIRGLIGKPGSTVFQMNGQPTAQNTHETGVDGELPAFFNWSNGRHVAELARRWNVDVDTLPHWSEPTHALQIFRFAEMLSIRMLWIQCTNPAVSLPDLGRIRSILANPDLFLVVTDAFLTETAELADVVLPAAIWGEKTGTFTNVDRTCHISLKAVEPPGEARSDFDIFLDYARRMDFRDRDGAPLIKFDDPEGAFDEFRELTRGRPCDYSGMSYEKLKGGSGIQWPCNEEHPDGCERLYTDGVFATDPDYCVSFGKDIVTGANMLPEEYRAKAPAGRAFLKAAEHMPPTEHPDEDYPFWLSTGRLVYQFHTRTKTDHSEELHGAAPDAFIAISAEDAADAGIAPGDWMRVESRRGVIEAPARLAEIPRGRLFVPFHFGYWDDPGRARAANELTLYEWDPASRQPHYKFAAVKITRVDGPSTPQPNESVRKQVTLKDRARHLAEAAVELVKPQRKHVADYLGLLLESEEALATMFEEVSAAHLKDAGVHNMCGTFASWTRGQLDPLRDLAGRHGTKSEREPRKLRRAIAPTLMPTGFGLIRDLHDCWLMANESHISLRVLHQASLALRDENMKSVVERIDHQNERQRRWLFTKIMEAAPQALTVPE